MKFHHPQVRQNLTLKNHVHHLLNQISFEARGEFSAEDFPAFQASRLPF
jgi:hypothetical protein